jgi:uncharacterized RDD family membrane protein YckC
MTSRFFRAVLTGLLLAAAGGVASAQGRGQQDPPPPAPPLEVEAVPAPGEQPAQLPRTLRRSMFRMAQDYILPAGDEIPEIRVVFGNATIEGHVRRDVVVIMGSARLAGTAAVGGSLVVIGGTAEIEAGATVNRDLVVVGGTAVAPVEFSPGGEHVVIGTPWMAETARQMLPWLTRGLLLGRLIVPDLAWTWTIALVFFLLYLALNAVFSGPVGSAADAIAGRPLSAFFTGMLVLLLTVPVLVIVAASVVGLVIIPFLLCGLLVAAWLGKTAVARAIGRSVLRVEVPEGRGTALLAFTIGAALLTLAYMVPLVGIVTWALTTVLGLGAASTMLRSHLRRERAVAAPPPEVVAAVPMVAAAGAGDAADAIPYQAELPPPPPPMAPPPATVFTQGLAQYPRATFLDRLAAFVLDVVLVAIVSGFLDLDLDEGWFFFFLLAYHIAFWAWKGTTLGGIICNLRVIRTDGEDPRFADAFVRGLSSIFSIVTLGIGCFWMIQDPERQMWHDKIAGTLVVKVPRHVLL